MNIVFDKILENKVIAIVRGVDEEYILDTAKALYDGGISLIEVTFNQNDSENLIKTPKLIKMIADNMADEILVGAGTVMTIAQCEAAYNAGAKYIISPNTDVEVIKKTKELGMISIPGSLTPSESVIAHNVGADFVKLFPAGNLGLGYIKALCSPLNHIPFLAVGGINAQNVADFMNVGIKGVGVGGSLVDVKAIKAGNFDKITAIAREYIDALK